MADAVACAQCGSLNASWHFPTCPTLSAVAPAESCADPECSICGGGQAQFHDMLRGAGLEETLGGAPSPARRRRRGPHLYSVKAFLRLAFWGLLAADAALWLVQHV